MGPRMLGPKMPMWALQRSCPLDSSGHGWQCLRLWASHPCKYKNVCVCVCVCVCARSVTQSCLTNCDPMDCSPPVFLCPWDFSSNHTGEGCHFLLQRIFPTQGSNPGLLHCKKVLSHCATWEAINMKYINLNISMLGASPGGSVAKNPPANEGDLALILGPGRSHVPRSS